jgi:isoleucyl-tRNA synthetase
MSFTRQVISEGLAQRAEAGMKVRQPLRSVSVYDQNNRLSEEFKDIITEELNVKELEIRHDIKFEASATILERWKNRDTAEFDIAVLDLTITPQLRQEGLMREVIRNVQQARKQADLEVDDRIALKLESTAPELRALLKNKSLTDTIQQETLATSLNNTSPEGFTKTVKIDEHELLIDLKKV